MLDGIDISYTSPESRFRQGFYVVADGNTTVAELAYYGMDAKYSIRYDMNLEGQKVLDLTNSKIASEWGFLQPLLKAVVVSEMIVWSLVLEGRG